MSLLVKTKVVVLKLEEAYKKGARTMKEHYFLRKSLAVDIVGAMTVMS